MLLTTINPAVALLPLRGIAFGFLRFSSWINGPGEDFADAREAEILRLNVFRAANGRIKAETAPESTPRLTLS